MFAATASILAARITSPPFDLAREQRGERLRRLLLRRDLVALASANALRMRGSASPCAARR